MTTTFRPCQTCKPRWQKRSDADVVVDLSDTTFIDSAVLGTLIASHRDTMAAGRRWSLVAGGGSGPAVQRILELTGLGSVMTVHATRAEALGVPVTNGEEQR